MLALNSKLRLTLMLVGTFTLLGGLAFGQQTPSQRYQPLRDGIAPPSVHVAPQQMQKLPSKFQTGNPNFQAAPNGVRPANTGARYSFSDQNPTSAYQRPVASRSQAGGAMIQQASFQVDQNGDPIVPAILAGQSNPPATNPTAQQQQAPMGSAPVVDEIPRKTPDDFAAAMNHASSDSPRIAPGELATQSMNISAQMADLRRRAEERAQAQSIEAQAAAEQQEIARLESEKFEAQQIEAGKIAAAQAQAEEMRLAAERQEAERMAADRLAVENEEAERLAQQAEEVSASDFIGSIASKPAANEPAPIQDHNTSPKLVVNQVGDVPAVMQLANNKFVSQPVRDPQVRPVSSEENTDSTTPSIKLSAPALEVETYGPQTVGVNKAANYQVIVRNTSSSQADRVLVGIDMPEWIDIENVNLTTGGKEITDGKNQARLVWSIDKIPGNSSQTITITAVPRKAEVFDVGVEWTLVPRAGKTSVNVTEPRLEMSIAGPPEVLYGETALYHVTVRNPGTGAAENVVVMLPEALGGERASLGDIEAGKEKNFQVELLARTAGELNLIATAAAEGNLKTSAERALTVRRANLEISLEGPGLKYAGSVAQYTVRITNSGDATANDIVTAVALPTGVTYVSGIESVKLIEGGMRWPVGSLEPGQTRDYAINCQLDTSGDLQLEVGARGRGDLAASSACLTTVETVADLVLKVTDPKGPLPTGEEISYQITVQNRGSKSARGVNLVMQFSEGIEPKIADGLEHQIVPGQVLFSPIANIDPGQEMSFKVTAEAMKAGTHVFRAQLICEESDSREIAEGTTRFFGETVQSTTKTANSTDNQTDFGTSDFGSEFKR